MIIITSASGSQRMLCDNLGLLLVCDIANSEIVDEVLCRSGAYASQS